MSTTTVQTYRGCQLIRERGPARYFGHPDYPRVSTQYRTSWVRVLFPDRTWCLCGTLGEARAYVDAVGYRHAEAA